MTLESGSDRAIEVEVLAVTQQLEMELEMLGIVVLEQHRDEPLLLGVGSVFSPDSFVVLT